ncbi:MAG: hypothetical protein WCR24_01280 [Candidatus Methanomethylophilaceae archaeon]
MMPETHYGKRNELVRKDFAFGSGDVGGAFCELTKALLIFMVVPLSIYALISGVADQAIASGTMNPETVSDVEEIVSTLWYYVRKFIRYSIPMLFLAVPIGFYSAGSYAKIPFRIIAALYLAVLLIMFTNGGDILISLYNVINTEQLIVNSVSVNIDIAPIIYMMVIICIAKAFLSFAEFAGSREKYLEDSMKKQQKAAGKSRKTTE